MCLDNLTKREARLLYILVCVVFWSAIFAVAL
jgi:hypothetical protein